VTEMLTYFDDIAVRCYGEPDEAVIRWVAVAVGLLPGGGS
jgi:hypothetical protein